jgi:hypothetical protein
MQADRNGLCQLCRSSRAQVSNGNSLISGVPVLNGELVSKAYCVSSGRR